MNISSHSYITGTIISLSIIGLLFVFGKYFTKYKYAHIGDIKYLPKLPDKYRLYILIISVLLPSIEFMLEIFHIRDKKLFIPNIFVGLCMLTFFFASKYFAIISKNLHNIMLIFYLVCTVNACWEINSTHYNIISLVEFTAILTFSSYIIYNIKYFFGYIISLFFFLMSLHIWGNLTLETLIICDSVIIMSFGINYGRYIIDNNITQNLFSAYNIVNKGNILVVGVNPKGIVEFSSENIQTILGFHKDKIIGKNWDKELSSVADIKIEDEQVEHFNPNTYLKRFTYSTGNYKLIEWQEITQEDGITLKIGRDITTKQQIRKELERTNQRLESLLNNSGDLVFVLDENYVFTDYYYENINELYIPPKDFIGKSFLHIELPVETKTNILHALDTANKTHKKAITEYYLPFATGTEWFSLSISVILNKENHNKEFVGVARNITESKKAEHKLIESNNRLLLLEKLINNSKDSFCITREDGTLFYVNNIAAERFGINPENASQYKVIDVEEKFEGKEEAWQAHLAEVKSHSRFVMEGVNINQKTKVLHPAEITVSYSVVQEQGFVTATIRDISERKKNEAEILAKNEALAASELQLKQNLAQLQKAQEILEQQQAEIIHIKDRFEVAINGSNDGIWDWDLQTNTVYFSPRWKSMLGYEDHEVANNYDAFINLIREDYKEVIENNIRNYFEEKTEKYYMEFPMLCKNGEYCWILSRGAALRDAHNKPYRMSGSHTDISEIRKIQSQLKQLSLVAEKATNGIAIADKNGFIQWANQAFLEMFEVPLEKLLNQKPSVLFNINGATEVEEMEKLNPINFVMEKEIKTYTQKHKWVELNHTAVKDEQGNVLQQIEILTDISERKKSEQELLEKQEQLQQLLDVTSNQNQRLQNFAHIVSHNIRSHSSNLSMLISFLNEPENDAEQQKFFSMLKLSTSKLAETVENLNEIITIQNNLNVPKTLLSMKTEIDKTMQALNTIILANEVTVINNVSADVCIKGLTSYIESILLNMLTNAIKYRSPERACVITFSAIKKGFFWVISIEDNGLGIDLAKHGHKLFGMYKTFHKNADARGIGLFITKNQIEAMGGKIEVESKVGIGSTFKIFFLCK